MLVDVEGSSQDLKEIAQALAQGLKTSQPAMTAMPALPAPQGATRFIPSAGGEPNGNGAATLNGGASLEPVPAEAEVEVPPSKPQSVAKRKFKTPTLISSLEFTSGEKPFQDYMDE